jgi:hypothetical protein
MKHAATSISSPSNAGDSSTSSLASGMTLLLGVPRGQNIVQSSLYIGMIQLPRRAQELIVNSKVVKCWESWVRFCW